MPSLLEKASINHRNLDSRKEFIRLTDRDIAILRSLRPWARRIAPKLAKEFYDHQLNFPATRCFLEKHAERKGMTLNEFRHSLENAQSGYYESIFEEAAERGQFGPRYAERRLFVGKLHNAIDLPTKWYLGSYCLLMDLTRKCLSRRFFYRPVFRRKAERAIFTVMNYDMQLVIDAFTIDLLDSIGLNLDKIENPDLEEDLSDYFRTIKRAIKNTIDSTLELADELPTSGHELSSAAEDLSTHIQKQVDLLEEASANLAQVNESASHNANYANDAAEKATGSNEPDENLTAIAAIEQIKDSSTQISNITSVIDDIAFQTNLLSLNASVESARAGNHGRGFAVVATEVRNLSQRTSNSSDEVQKLIKKTVHTINEGYNLVTDVAEMVHQISDQSNNQSSRLNEVKQAIEQIEQTTQSIAAQSEELTTVAETLKERTTRLQDVAQWFTRSSSQTAED